MIDVTVKNTISFPPLFTKDDLMFIARRIILKGIVQNIERQTALDGGSFPELEESTKKAKAKKGQPNLTLVATSKLLSNLAVESISDTAVKVFIRDKDNRPEIGRILQNVGVGKKKKKFNFFGISTDMEEQGIAHTVKRIKENLRRGK